jgi:PAS domain S-box-containing protein
MTGFSLTTAIAITSGMFFLISVFLLGLSRGKHSIESANSYKLLAAAYGFNGLRLVSQLLVITSLTGFTAAGDVLYIGFISCFWFGIRAYVQPKPFRRVFLALPLLLIVWTIFAQNLAIPFPWLAIPPHFAGTTIFVLSGYHVWGLYRKNNNWDLLFLALMIWAQGASTASYPFTRMTWYAPYGFALIAFLATAIGLALMVAALRNEQQELAAEVDTRKKAEKLQERSLIFIETLLANSPAGVIVYEGDTGNCVHVNQAYADIIGGTIERVLQQNFRTLSSWRDAGIDAIAELTLVDGITRRHEAEANSSFGKTFIIESSFSRFIVENKPFLLLMASDVTERRHAEDERRKSEDKHRAIIQTAMDGFLLVDATGRFLEINEAYCRMSGYSAQELLGMGITDVEAKDSAEETAVRIHKIKERGYDRFESLHRRKDGSIFEVELNVQYRPVDGGQFVTFLQDITERKQVEQNVQYERNLSMDILNAQPAGIYRVRVFAHETWKKDAWLRSESAPYTMELISESFCNILGTTKEAFENNPGMLIDLVYPDDKEEFAKKNEEAAEDLKEFMWEGRLLIDGMIRWVHFHSLPRPLENGDVLWTGALIDITDGKKAEEEKQILEYQFQQAQKLESLGVLSGGIAHDFNNILAIIMGNCSLAKMDSENAASYIPEIEKATDRAAALCRQMLTYAGKAQLTRSQVNLWVQVDEMITMLKATLPQNVIIKPVLQADFPYILGDASQIRQIVMNLVINASEAIGEAQGEIRVSLVNTRLMVGQEKDYHGKEIPTGDYICLDVTDTGCGMDEETRWRIFEPFYTTKFTGRGLGMSAVLGIIAAHQGALQLYSQVGQGTTFKVYLPSDPAGAESHRETDSAAPWYGSGTILLVEDEEMVRSVANSLLDMLGFTVIEASNGKEALELYQNNASDITLVVTDMGMPIMDGYALFRELKRLNPGLPIVVSSGFGDTVVTTRIAKEDIAGLISKPYNFEQLREVVKSALGIK